MDIVVIIISAALAMLFGGIAMWLLLRKRISASSADLASSEELKVDFSEDDTNVDKQIVQLRKELSHKSDELELLLQKEKSLQHKLEEKNKELSYLKTNLEVFRNSSDQNESEVLSLLKKDLSNKEKQLEDKEEEIEDLEDEISSIKKKLNKLKGEKDDVEEKLSEIEKQLKSMQQTLEATEIERDDLKNENNQNVESIEFVNAIIGAKDSDDRDALEYAAKVQKVEDIVNDQYIPLLKQYFKDCNDVAEADSVKVKELVLKWGNLQRKSWLKGKKVIAFIGEFSAGKTSIVNRILSQDDPDCPKLPVSSKATTAIATYISYGATFLSQFTDQNGNLKLIEKSMFEKVDKDILARVNVSPIIRHFVMKYNNVNLKGLSILDMPGFSSNDEKDKDRTLDVVNEADALFWVMDANSGEINRTSLKIISDNLKDLPLYVIINKADTKSPGELDKLEKHIRQTMERSGIKVQGYLRFSQKAELEELMSIVKTLPDVRTGSDIGSICLFLQEKLNQISNELKKINHDMHEQENSLSIFDDEIESKLSEQCEAAERIKDIPELKSPWFSEDYYKMDQYDYEELKELCGSVYDGSHELEDFFDLKTNCQKKYNKYKNINSELKEQKSDIKKVFDQLLRAIKNLDENLYREIEDDLKCGQGYKRDNKKSKSNVSDNSKKVSEDNENQKKQDPQTVITSGDNVKDYMSKAETLMQKGKKDEAIFWYIMAAQAGNKDAQKQCKKYNVKY